MRGGKRENAGRKVGKLGPRLSLSVRLTGQVLEFLRTQPDSAGQVIERSLRATGEFRRFLQRKGE